MNILVTGGAGFIGSSLVRYLLRDTIYNVIVIDKLTYAGNLDSLSSAACNERYSFEKIDICNKGLVKKIFFSIFKFCNKFNQ